MTIHGPLDLDVWRDRIAGDVPQLRSVGLAAELSSAQEDLRATPQAFIVPVSDTPASRPGHGNSVRAQNVNAIVGVVLAVSNNRGSSIGSGASLDIQALRRLVMNTLIGWQPPGTDVAIQFGGGKALLFQDSTVWWTDRFVTSYFVRKEFN